MMNIPSNGGEQEMLMLPLSYLNGWLFGVDTKRVKPGIKERLIDYQKECYMVLANHFLPAQPRREAAEYLSNNDDANLRRCIWQIADNMGYEQAWIQGTWHSIRQATGVKSPNKFEVRHLPAIACEIERILKTAIRLTDFQRKLERDVTKHVLRKGEPVDSILNDLERNYEEKLTALVESANEVIPEWTRRDLDRLLKRLPNGYDSCQHMREE